MKEKEGKSRGWREREKQKKKRKKRKDIYIVTRRPVDNFFREKVDIKAWHRLMRSDDDDVPKGQRCTHAVLWGCPFRE